MYVFIPGEWLVYGCLKRSIRVCLHSARAHAGALALAYADAAE